MNRLAIFGCAVVALLGSVSTASAQLVFSSRTAVAGAGSAYYLDVNSLSLTRLWTQASNHRPGGLAADGANGILYNVDSARLSTWNYGSIGTVSTFVSANGGLFRSNGTTNTGTGVDGLEFVNGTLYGWTNFGSTVYSDGLYSIVPSGTFAGLMQPVWTCPDSTWDFEGLAYNPADGFMYGTNATTNTTLGSTPGLYKFDGLRDPNAVPVRVAGYDSSIGISNYDGLAIGGGFAWLTAHVNGTLVDNSDDLLVISKYDLATGQYVDSIGVNIPSSGNITTGAAWAPGALTAVPEPATLTICGAGLALIATRRRNS